MNISLPVTIETEKTRQQANDLHNIRNNTRKARKRILQIYDFFFLNCVEMMFVFCSETKLKFDSSPKQIRVFVCPVAHLNLA